MKQNDQEALVLLPETLGALLSLHHIDLSLIAPSTEVAALRDGLLLAQQIGCKCVEIQSDCMEVVQMMHDGGFSAMTAVALYDEIVQLWQKFGKISISHLV